MSQSIYYRPTLKYRLLCQNDSLIQLKYILLEEKGNQFSLDLDDIDWIDSLISDNIKGARLLSEMIYDSDNNCIEIEIS